MATLSIGLAKVGKRPCQCHGMECVHKGESVAKQHGKPVPYSGPGEWVPEYLTVPNARDPEFTRKRHRRGDP